MCGGEGVVRRDNAAAGTGREEGGMTISTDPPKLLPADPARCLSGRRGEALPPPTPAPLLLPPTPKACARAATSRRTLPTLASVRSRSPADALRSPTASMGISSSVCSCFGKGRRKAIVPGRKANSPVTLSRSCGRAAGSKEEKALLPPNAPVPILGVGGSRVAAAVSTAAAEAAAAVLVRSLPLWPQK